MRECENKRDNQQHFAFSPSHSLLVPQSGDDTKNGKDKSNHVQGHLPVAGVASMLQLTVLHAVAHVDVQTDEHPQHQAYPCIGRKEQHHAKASKNTQYGDKWNKWGFKGTGHVRHGSAYYQYSGTDQREGHQRADACHLSGQPCGYKSCQQAHKYHEEQVAACRSTELFVDMREERRQQPVVAHAQEYAALSQQRHHDDGAISEQNRQHDGTVQPGIVRLDDTCRISLPHVLYGYGNGSNALLSAEGGVVCHSRHDVGKNHIEHGAYQQGDQNADRHVPLRVLRLLGSCAHSVEPEEGEEYDGRPSQDAGEAIFAQHARIGRDVRCIVVGIDVFPAEYDKNQYDGNLQEYNEAVEDGAALRTPYQEEAHQHDDKEGGDIYDSTIPGTGGEDLR